MKEVEGFNHQVINNSNIVICAYHRPFQESYLVSQERYLVWDVQLCIVLYLNIFQCIVCLQYVLNSLGFCSTLEILGDGFLEMDGHWWSCVMIFILIFETILRLAYPKSKNGVVVHMYNDTC